MDLRLTLGVLLALTAALVLLRIYWLHLPRPMRTLLVACALIVLAAFTVAYATKWCTSSLRWNYGLYWLMVASGEFLLILFTRVKPRWLTTIIAALLIVPILSASIFIPLSLVFAPLSATAVPLGDHIVSERVPWGTGTVETTGTDLTIYYQPAWMPLLRRNLLSARYYGGQCDAGRAYAVLQPDRKHVDLRCPAATYLSADSARSIVLPLYRPLFRKHIKEVIPSSK